MTRRFRKFIPLAAGIAGTLFLAGVYIGIVSWAESPQHAADLFWEDRWLVLPILLAFGVQVAIYSVLKLRLHLPDQASDPHGETRSLASMGAGGATSTAAMVACCAHHVTDVLPILGLSAAAAFFAQYQTLFMAAGLASNLIGIGIILSALLRERRNYFRLPAHLSTPFEDA